jgi:hypothetical protein
LGTSLVRIDRSAYTLGAAAPRSAESPARIPSEAAQSAGRSEANAAAVANDAAQIRLAFQHTLRSQGLLRENSADRRGLSVEVDPSGDVTLEGSVRDLMLYREVVRRAQEVARAPHVTQNIRSFEAGEAP